MKALSERVVLLVKVLGMTPSKTGAYLWKEPLGRWWLRGCIDGDQPLPQTKGCHTEKEALEAVEAWLAPEIAEHEEEEFDE